MNRSFTRAAHATLTTVLVASSAACPLSAYEPCVDDGVIDDNIRYIDGRYTAPDGLTFAYAGSDPFARCRTVTGKIVLTGTIEHFDDFHSIESVFSFVDNDVTLPDARGDDIPENLEACGLVRGFPNLVTIEGSFREMPGELQHPCWYRDGFDALAYVGDDFDCFIGSDNLGTELVEVWGKLSCPSERLGKLERVESHNLSTGGLPSLIWAGSLTMVADHPDETIAFPMLQSVGDGYEPSLALAEPPARLALSGWHARTLQVPRLELVAGPLTVANVSLRIPELWADDGRPAAIRALFESVEVTGRREICRNGETDPCPWEDECPEVHGPDSILCCTDSWPECLEEFEGDQQ